MWKRGGTGHSNFNDLVKRCRKCNRTVKNTDCDFREGFCFDDWLTETEAGRKFAAMLVARKAAKGVA